MVVKVGDYGMMDTEDIIFYGVIAIVSAEIFTRIIYWFDERKVTNTQSSDSEIPEIIKADIERIRREERREMLWVRGIIYIPGFLITIEEDYWSGNEIFINIIIFLIMSELIVQGLVWLSKR